MAWTTPERVREWLRLAESDTDQSGVAECVNAAEALVTRYAGPAPADDAPEAQQRPDGSLAATMMAARLYRRRNSPEGVQTITADAALYVARTDPDIARLLRIDQYQTPMVG